jgi:hypothetical protein
MNLARRRMMATKDDLAFEIIQPTKANLIYTFEGSKNIPSNYLIKDGVLNTSCAICTKLAIGYNTAQNLLSNLSYRPVFTHIDNYLEFTLPKPPTGTGHWGIIEFYLSGNSKYNILNFEVTGTGFKHYQGTNVYYGSDDISSSVNTWDNIVARETINQLSELSSTSISIEPFKNKWIGLGMNNQSSPTYITNIYNVWLSS